MAITRGKYYHLYRAQFPGYRFLVVDDDLDRIAWFQRSLSLHCFDGAPTVDRARKLIKLTPPYDGIFLNPHLRDNTNAGLVDWLVRRPSMPKVPVVVYEPGIVMLDRAQYSLIPTYPGMEAADRLHWHGWEVDWIPIYGLEARHDIP